MTLDNMTGITKGSYTGFCKNQLITCNFVKTCNGVCPFEDALKHADKMQTINEQHTVDHFDKANQIILDALQFADRPTGWIPVSERLPNKEDCPMDCVVTRRSDFIGNYVDMAVCEKNGTWTHEDWDAIVLGDVESGKSTGLITTRDDSIIAWMPLPEPYKSGESDG